MKRLLIVLSMVIILSSIGSAAIFASDVNIAKDCSVSVSATVRYGMGEKLPSSLTDGYFALPGVWNQKGILGWETREPVGITIDLGKDQPISGVMFDSISENSEWSKWPADIRIFTSDDSKTWRYEGELTSLSNKYGIPQPEGLAKFQYVTHDLQTHGRYMRLIVSPYMESFFTDEIEIYKGNDEFLTKPFTGIETKDTRDMTRKLYFNGRVIYRLNSDLQAVRKAIANSSVSASEKQILNDKLDNIEKIIPSVKQENTPDFKAILPINDVNAQIFSVYGSLLKSSGYPKLFAWKTNPYAFLSPTSVPEKKSEKVEVSVSMIGNEFRADSFLLTNASNAPYDATITLKGLPGGAKPEWLSVYAIPWVDTNMGTPISSALVPAVYKNGAFVVSIPAGLTAKIWLSVDSSKIDAGTYDGKLLAKCKGSSVTIPVNIYVSTVKMGRPRLSFTMWDYTYVPGTYAVTPGNIDLAVSLMKSHYMDSPWMRPENIPLPDNDAFDKDGNLIKQPSFEGMDKWLTRWSGSRHFLLFLNAPTNIGGAEMGTKEFDARVASWAKALSAHISSLGVKPEDFSIMVRDEPGGDALSVILAWAKPIINSKSGITIFQDCNNSNAYKTELESEALNLTKIACPEISPFYIGGEGMRKFVEDRVSNNKETWFYQCNGPSRLLDPYQYNRMEAWHCFKYGAKGMGQWAFADTGAFKDSWNEYTCGGPSYTPLFFKGDEILSSINFEASREGAQDYEYLSMLKEKSQTCIDSQQRCQAEDLIKEAVDSVMGEQYVREKKWWNQNNDRTQMDKYRLTILKLLEKME